MGNLNLGRSYLITTVPNKILMNLKYEEVSFFVVKYSHLSNKRSPDFITKVSDIIAEPNDDFSHNHFEL